MTKLARAVQSHSDSFSHNKYSSPSSPPVHRSLEMKVKDAERQMMDGRGFSDAIYTYIPMYAIIN